MANPKTYSQPNHAVYEEQGPYTGPVALSPGGVSVGGQQAIAVHQNTDGSITGVTEDGRTVWVPRPPSRQAR